MGTAIITLKIMPEGPDIDLELIRGKAEELITKFTEDNGEKKSLIEPVAFGIKALKITFVMDESKGSTDSLEEEIKKLEGVQSVEVVDVRRAIG